MDTKHIIVLTLMLSTLLVLIAGLTLMMRGGTLNEKYGRKLMVARVGLQSLTLIAIGLFLLLGK